MSFFDLCPVMANELNFKRDRMDLLRSGVRRFDLSQAVSAGALAVVAIEQQSDLPIKLDIDGTTVTGPGATVFQAVLPLKQRPPEEDPDAPATKPATAPATMPALIPAAR